MAALEISQFICHSDNYAVLLHDPESGQTASIDAPNAVAIQNTLAEHRWTLSHIFVTHHHQDHVEGVEALKQAGDVRVIGPKKAADKLSFIDLPVAEGNVIEWAGRDIRVLDTPGHTLDHISYWFPDDDLVFAADCLFSLGCGRVFEGDHAMMWDSLEKLAALPDATRLYCGHEYTLTNARYALKIDPDNAALKTRAHEVARLRQNGRMTLPTTIGSERRLNPFLRANELGLKKVLGMEDASAAEVFAHLRLGKDRA